MVIITDHTPFKPSFISNIRVGALIGAGLPNITGEVVMYGCEAWSRAGTLNGCFYWVNQTATNPSHHTTPYEKIPNLQFNAGWANNVYGASNTVTPLSLGVAFYIKF